MVLTHSYPKSKGKMFVFWQELVTLCEEMPGPLLVRVVLTLVESLDSNFNSNLFSLSLIWKCMNMIPIRGLSCVVLIVILFLDWTWSNSIVILLQNYAIQLYINPNFSLSLFFQLDAFACGNTLVMEIGAKTSSTKVLKNSVIPWCLTVAKVWYFTSFFYPQIKWSCILPKEPQVL